MTRGFLLGKFMPPHNGHVFLCDFAQAYCDDLTILVCSLDSEPIPGDLRFAWMREMYPDCRVVHLSDDVPQEPSDSPDFWNIWRGIVQRAHPEPIDFVFASEPYGERLAAEANARFVPVDIPRAAVPVSGTAIRDDPLGNWKYIPPAVRPHFVKKICVFGPESTGKTTLARDLADKFQTALAPEYGRIYTEIFGFWCEPSDLTRIARGQVAATHAAARQANRILVMDTDPVLTVVWSDMLIGGRDPYLETFTDTADLYLLTAIDIPWDDDGTRYFPDEATRRRFFDACKAELDRRDLSYVTLTGDRAKRLADATAAIEKKFGVTPTGE